MATCEHLMDREAEVRICKDKPKELKTENGVADCIIVGGESLDACHLPTRVLNEGTFNVQVAPLAFHAL